MQMTDTVRRILASDIDGTLTGCPVAAARFVDWHAQRDDGLLFAVATGRSVSQARRVLADWALPRPDLFITSVGSEIWRWGAGDRLHPCADYAALLDADWDRDAVQAVLQARAPVWQAGYEQRRWKLSLLGTAAQAAGIERDLARAGLAARVIASHGEFIDVLPQAAGKAAALRFEATRRGLDLRHCIAAGDSARVGDGCSASPPVSAALADPRLARGQQARLKAARANVVKVVTSLGAVREGAREGR